MTWFWLAAFLGTAAADLWAYRWVGSALALAAAVACLATALGLPGPESLIVFALAAGLSLAFVRPLIARRAMRGLPATAWDEGREPVLARGVALTRLTAHGGQVRLDGVPPLRPLQAARTPRAVWAKDAGVSAAQPAFGTRWSAVPLPGLPAIEPGARVEVVYRDRARGHVVVRPAREPSAHGQP